MSIASIVHKLWTWTQWHVGSENLSYLATEVDWDRKHGGRVCNNGVAADKNKSSFTLKKKEAGAFNWDCRHETTGLGGCEAQCSGTKLRVTGISIETLKEWGWRLKFDLLYRAWNKNFGMYRQMSIQNHFCSDIFKFCAAIAFATCTFLHT